MISQKKQSLTVLLGLACILAIGAGAVAQAVSVSRPVLTSLHPTFISVKEGPVVALATGQNFVPGISTVQIQGKARQTTVLNPEALAFELTAADLTQHQTLLVNIVNRIATQSFKSNSLPLVVLP